MSRRTVISRRAMLQAIPATSLALGFARPARADLASLAEAARREGSVTWYSSLVPGVNQGIVEAMRGRYGIDVRVLRLASGPLTQRYSAEAESGKIAADVIMPASSGPFLASALAKGWTVAPEAADLPAITGGEFPRKWLRSADGAAIIQVLPWIYGYNEELVARRGIKLPADWPDLLHPSLRGQILVPDPAATDSYIQLWDFVLRSYGEDYLRDLRKTEFRITESGAPNIQAVAAGEGALGLPTIGSLVEGVAKVGAPVKALIPAHTTGNEIAITLSRNAPKPNAAKLLVNFILSREGNMILGGSPFEFSVYRTDLPAGYRSPDPNAVAQSKDKIIALLKGK